MTDQAIQQFVLSVIFFFGCFLFSYQKGNRQSKGFLGGFFIVIGLIILDILWQRNGFYKGHLRYAVYSK